MLYWFPKTQGRYQAEAVAREHGLDVFTGPCALIACATGPCGNAGQLAKPGAKAAERLEYLDTQTWVNCGGGFWLGWEGAAPGPEDLARKEKVGGHTVRLADGRDWMVPLARVFPEGTLLPRVYTFGPNGEEVQDVMPRYVGLSRKAEALFERYSSGEGWEFSEDEGFALAAEALGVNYRITAYEARALGLFTTQNVRAVLHALYDGPTVEARIEAYLAEKKTPVTSTTPPLSGSSDGFPADCGSTGQPLPSPLCTTDCGVEA